MTNMSSDNSFAIEAHDLTKLYGNFPAVDHISFEVKNGEFFGFLGPNGAGKTTTARMLAGVIKADNGSATIMGYQAGSLKAKQVAGVIPEMSNAYPDLSAWDNLMLMAELYGVSPKEAKERTTALLRQMDLLERKSSHVQTYSKGMRQRLVMCMSLISDPQVLFLDEPTSGLDVQSARLMKDILRSLNAAGKTIFLTTHDMEEANQLCHRVAIINKGRLVTVDAPEKLRMAVSGMRSVEVSFDGTVDEQTLEKMPGVSSLKKTGDKYLLYTPHPGDLACSITSFASSSGKRIVSLNTLAPSLEDAFVALTTKDAKK